MNEADVLGDRIAILANGRLQCYGSSYFLKKRYGSGYRLVIVKDSQCKAEQITAFLQGYIPQLKIETDVGRELTYILPEFHVRIFEKMLSNMDNSRKSLGIESYGISLATLEEVFIRVGAECDEDNDNRSNTVLEAGLLDNHETYLTGFALYRNQLLAMMLKRALVTMRSWLVLIALTVLAVITAILIMETWRTGSKISSSPRLDFTLDSYSSPVTVITATTKNNTYYKNYKEILQNENRKIVDRGNEDMNDYLLKKTSESMDQVRTRFIIGAAFFGNNTIVAWFNDQPYHSPPLALQYVYNSILKEKVGPDYNIEFGNYPFRETTQDANIGLAFLYNVMTISMFITFVVPYYTLFCVKERVCQSKHLQVSSGTDVSAFWTSPKTEGTEDADVLEEKRQIRQGIIQPSTHEVLLKNTTKYFKKFLAVNQLCIGIKQYECFGLLGVNGAGKTTVFRMMTGDLRLSYGDAWICQLNIKNNMKDIHRCIGYCPQFDGLLDNLTVKETLIMYCLIRGIPLGNCSAAAIRLSQELQFTNHINKRINNLSGGNKRKVSAAIALIGEPPVLFLDEPSTGMDPKTKRFLWDKLCRIRDNGRCLVLTTHSMDECEAICTRVGIMVNGAFQCLGSSQYLKNKFADGYVLIIKVKKGADLQELQSNIQDVKLFIDTNFRGAELKESHGRLLSYIVKGKRISWPAIFGTMERGKTAVKGMEDYSLSQFDLEQIFLLFTRMQRFPTDWRTNQMFLPIGTHIKKGEYIVESMYWLFLRMQHHLFREVVKMLLYEEESGFKYNWTKKMKEYDFDDNKYNRELPDVRLCLQHHYRTFIHEENFYEPEPEGFDIGIQVLHLKKKYGKDHIVLRNISFNMFENEITILVGQNGTGKTTLMSILSGILPPTFGTAIIGGYDIKTDMEKIRESLGFCPQHNVLFNLLTVKEHLYFFCKIRGLKGENLNEEIEMYLKLLDLTNQANTKVKSLSEGIKRKLSIGIAMCGNSRVCIMDEPTSGLDPKSRRQVWAAIRAHKIENDVGNELTCILPESETKVFEWMLGDLEACREAVGIQSYGLSLATLEEVFMRVGVEYDPAQEDYQSAAPNGFSSFHDEYLTGFGLYINQILAMILKKGLLTVRGWRPLVLHILLPIISAVCCLYTTQRKLIHEPKLNFTLDTYSSPITVMTSTEDENRYYKAYKEILDVNKQDIRDWGNTDMNNRMLLQNAMEVTSAKLTIIAAGIMLVLPYYGLACAREKLSQAKDIQLVSGIAVSVFCKRPKAEETEDADVLEEKTKVRSGIIDPSTYDVVLKDTTKYFKKYLAVNQLCLGVKKYDCFGLLGVNGAGKTTTFKMLVGDLKISFGDAWICRWNLKSNVEESHTCIGYCPQFDSLLGNLTCKETLTIYCLIRGIPILHCNAVISALAKALKFENHINKRIKCLSGGNKRKIHIAIALIGEPPVILLDEPSSGMDPSAKVFLWNTLCKVRDRGSCILLTTHNMDECEAICTRAGIMVNGAFQCLGSPQYLKNKFADGFVLIVKVKKGINERHSESNIDDVKLFIQRHFRSAELRETHENLLNYLVKSDQISWATIFSIMERAKKLVAIEDYTLSQFDLEQKNRTDKRREDKNERQTGDQALMMKSSALNCSDVTVLVAKNHIEACNWWMDSGATEQMCFDKRQLHPRTIYLKKDAFEWEMAHLWQVEAWNENAWVRTDLINTLFVSDLDINLFSLSTALDKL
ncbi:atp-binding cassette transporter subfamily a abca [Holotrichia oblita]|uniref:Atp-binding cassette transporter subfamily a abca n=1 Tax=Holotrichia oblita TaxID=644536 RepID=A0ACB9T8N0_HOLOL|nr:atp-binding cassette transporter subfamily a abca [Holotrichia oblita]